MASTTTLVTTLRGNASIEPSEYDDTRLQGWLNDALNQHNHRYTLGTLPTHEIDCVIFLAWIKVCYARASAATLFYSVSGRSGSINKAEIVRNNLDLAQVLREDYISLCQRLGVNPAPEIVVSDVTKMDESLHAMTPVSAHTAPQVSTLSISNHTGTSVDLAWTEAIPKDTFLRYRLFFGNEAGLQDMTTLGDLDTTYYGVDNSKAQLLKTYDEIWRTSCRITGLDETLDYYFVLVVEDVNGKFSVSNEVSSGPAIPPEASSSLRYATFLLSGTLRPNVEYVQNISFTDKIKIETLNVQASTAPVDESLVVRVSTESGGGGESIELELVENDHAATLVDQNVLVPYDKAVFISTGSTVGAAADVQVIIGYRVAEKYSIVEHDGEDYRLSVEGTPAHVVIEKYVGDVPSLQQYCYVTDDDGNRYRLSVQIEPDLHIQIERLEE